MVEVVNPSTDPHFNVALDSWLVREAPADQDYVMLWQNAPAVIVGRYQNTYEEVNQDYAESHGISIVRRLSGGGAVYHDLGNLNFSLVVSSDGRPFDDYRGFTAPVIAALAQYGVTAELTGRNDLTLNGRKFSGNAQYRTRTRVLHHGTILFDADLERVPAVLHVRQDKIQSKGIKSVRTRVTNIRPMLPGGVSLAAFRATLLEKMGQAYGGISGRFVLDDPARDRVQALVDERYGQWQWNVGASPPFNYRSRQRFPAGELEVRLQVERGRIAGLFIYGDFLGHSDLDPLLTCLRGVDYTRTAVVEAVRGVDVPGLLGGIALADFLHVILDA